MLIAELLKFIGVCLSAASAIYATKTDQIKSSDSVKLTKKGWYIVIFAISGVFISGGAQIFQIYDILDSAKRNKERQEILTSRLENMSYQSVRQYYPLEPLTIVYELEYSMDQPALLEYTKKVQAQIVSLLKKQREGRGETRDDLSNENVIFNLMNIEDCKPTDRISSFNLLTDSTSFTFSYSKKDPNIRFLSAKEGEQNIFVSLPIKGKPSQKISLFGDFKKRVFIKEVKSVNPLRMGKDNTSISSLDLIGKKLSWSQSSSILPKESNAKWRLRKIGFVFSYDYQEGSAARPINNARTFEVNADTKSIIIGANHLGLEDVFEKLDLGVFFKKRIEVD